MLSCLLYDYQTLVFMTRKNQKVKTTRKAEERSILNSRKIHKAKSEVVRKSKDNRSSRTSSQTNMTMVGYKAHGPKEEKNVRKPKRKCIDDLIDSLGESKLQLSKNTLKYT